MARTLKQYLEQLLAGARTEKIDALNRIKNLEAANVANLKRIESERAEILNIDEEIAMIEARLKIATEIPARIPDSGVRFPPSEGLQTEADINRFIANGPKKKGAKK